MENYKHSIHYYETDKMSITHHSNYVRFMEEARTDFLSRLGWGYDRFEKDGVVSPVVSISCEYKKTSTFPEELEIIVGVKAVTSVRVRFCYTMLRGRDIICTAESEHCFLNADGGIVRLSREYPEFYNELVRLSDSGI